MAFLSNATFENGQAGWVPINGANLVTTQIVRDGTARSGSAFLRVKVDQLSCSVGSDFTLAVWNPLAVWNNYPDQFEFASTRSIGVIAYVRAAPGGPRINGELKLWSLGLESRPANSNGTRFDVGSEWTMLICAIDGTEFQYLPQQRIIAHPTIRVEFYDFTPGAYLDIDTVIVC